MGPQRLPFLSERGERGQTFFNYHSAVLEKWQPVRYWRGWTKQYFPGASLLPCLWGRLVGATCAPPTWGVWDTSLCTWLLPLGSNMRGQNRAPWVANLGIMVMVLQKERQPPAFLIPLVDFRRSMLLKTRQVLAISFQSLPTRLRVEILAQMYICKVFQMLHLKPVSTGSLPGIVRCPAGFGRVERCLHICCWAVTLPPLAAVVTNIQLSCFKGVFPHLWAPGRLIYFFPSCPPVSHFMTIRRFTPEKQPCLLQALLRGAQHLPLSTYQISLSLSAAWVKQTSWRRKYKSKASTAGQDFARPFHRAESPSRSPGGAQVPLTTCCKGPTTGLGLNTCKQGAFVKLTSPCLRWPRTAWGRVPGWPQARCRDPILELGALGSISSLATGFLCGLGQIIRCKACSQFADILREPWFGRWMSCVRMWGEEVLLLALVATQALAPSARVAILQSVSTRGWEDSAWRSVCTLGFHPRLVCKWQHLRESNLCWSKQPWN